MTDFPSAHLTQCKPHLCCLKLADVLKSIRSLRWRKITWRRQRHRCSACPCPSQTWLINLHFPIQSGCSFRILLITVLLAATSTGPELTVEPRPICHSCSNRTKMKHQKQQTGTNLSPFQRSERLPASTAPTPPPKPIVITARA